MDGFENRFSEERPDTPQEKLSREVSRYAGNEREKDSKLYFIFDSPEMRNQAMQVLNKLRDERREYDDCFSFFLGCKEDPERPDVGIEINFSKNPEGIREKFEKLLVDQGLMPREEYETVDGESRPGETKRNQAG